MKKKTNKTVDNANKTFQDAKSAVHSALEREYVTKKWSEANVNTDHVRKLKTVISFQANIDEVKVRYQHKMRVQAKLVATVLAKDKVAA